MYDMVLWRQLPMQHHTWIDVASQAENEHNITLPQACEQTIPFATVILLQFWVFWAFHRTWQCRVFSNTWTMVLDAMTQACFHQHMIRGLHNYIR